MLYIQVISPAATLYEGEAKYVHFPGAQGAFAVHKDHAPIVSLLQGGSIRCVDGNGQETSIEIAGGFVEVCSNKIVACVE